MTKFNIAVIVGSSRRESFNRKLAESLVALGSPKLAFDFVRIDDLPLFSQDIESPLPESVVRFKSEIAKADGLLFVTPEHNRSIPAMLKNAIDWGTRPYGQNVWAGKPAAITGTSPGAVGTAVAQQHLRQILGSILGVTAMSSETYITFKPGLLNEAGQVADESTRGFLQSFVDKFASFMVNVSRQQEQLREAAA
jgi:chromate reductase